MPIVNTHKGTAQNFTANWVDYGGEIGTDGHDYLSFWAKVDINLTTDARIRFVCKHTGGGADEYISLIQTQTASVVSVEDKFFELTNDIDQNIVFKLELNKVVPFVQPQIQAETVGGTAGQVLSSKYILN